ncbi:hypothetical protein EJ05DRAFT_485350 [Pseudovirgaria hyperparasitica]|uniref:Uncharacterized protein n=1 Tax=Pseudovirgaria hyperparasitica TaxID=470096 RepID=A0A6A6WBV2_9PEZI|nr:uncharacterized protein EJ05DRAFT_485350 [Pseudovirgaria hyperparasitica]KAF2759316.1 hypothetical protein EJ05DRAFT_485350 [Pseudovirgaria hyperparasitica]
MSSADEKTTFGAVVETHLSRPTPQHLDTTFSQASPISNFNSLPTTPTKLDHDPANPYFAGHSNGTEHGAFSKTHLDAYASDVEAGTPLSTATTVQLKGSVDGRLKECSKMSMWPSKQSLIADAKAAKRQRRCGGHDPMRNLSKKQKLTAKILIALLAVGLAVGLGVGISRAVGGGIWSGDHKTKYIPNDQGH